jgi:hypothetical protein
VVAILYSGIAEGAMELKKGSTHAAEVESAFVEAVQKHLPQRAFEELSHASREDIEAWAERWNVQAPCILDLAADFCEGGWSEGFGISSYSSPAIPNTWFDALHSWNALPVDSQWLESGLDHVMLAPIGADPVRESEASFLERARVHFQARMNQAKALGFVSVSPKHKLADHMDWLIRYQLHGESRAAIAQNACVVQPAVDRAIRELAAFLNLRLR